MNVAVVIGSEGQDGRLLFERLEQQGKAVIGIGRDSARASTGASVEAVDVTNRSAVSSFIHRVEPDRVFYLAAVHTSSQGGTTAGDADLFAKSTRVHFDGLVNFLEGMTLQKTGSLFYAASSLIFGEPAVQPQDELTPFDPGSPYAITKAAGVRACRYFRNQRGVNASAGILYNHESPLRGAEFVSQKIAEAAVATAGGRNEKLKLGSLDARIDWGYAPDFVDAMIRIAALPSGDDFVIATGETHSVREFAAAAFERVGLDWHDHVVEDRSLLTRKDSLRVGDSSRLRERTGWSPTVSFIEMVQIMVDAALERQQ